MPSPPSEQPQQADRHRHQRKGDGYPKSQAEAGPARLAGFDGEGELQQLVLLSTVRVPSGAEHRALGQHEGFRILGSPDGSLAPSAAGLGMGYVRWRYKS